MSENGWSPTFRNLLGLPKNYDLAERESVQLTSAKIQ